jgi:hypothetical protein
LYSVATQLQGPYAGRYRGLNITRETNQKNNISNRARLLATAFFASFFHFSARAMAKMNLVGTILAFMAVFQLTTAGLLVE